MKFIGLRCLFCDLETGEIGSTGYIYHQHLLTVSMKSRNAMYLEIGYYYPRCHNQWGVQRPASVSNV